MKKNLKQKIKLPKKIKIAGFDVTLVDWHPQAANAQLRFGEFSALESVIRIDTSVNNFKVVDTLLHEINHAIYWAYSMNDEDKEERIVSILGKAWTQVYRDNPELLDFIKYSLERNNP